MATRFNAEIPEYNYRGWSAFRGIDDHTGEQYTLLKIDEWAIKKVTGWLPDKSIEYLIDSHQSRLESA